VADAHEARPTKHRLPQPHVEACGDSEAEALHQLAERLRELA
jgi:hypothetical protein